MKRSWKVIIPLLLVLVLVLTSCGKKVEQEPPISKEEEVSQQPEDKADQKQDEPAVGVGEIVLPHPMTVKKDGATVGGTLNVAIVTDTPFEGIFNEFLSSNAVDSQLAEPLQSGFMRSGPNKEIANGGWCDVDFDREAKTATYRIHKDLTWSDGVPVTSDDLIFVYNSIGHKDYPGVRFDSDYHNVVGMLDYNQGKADTISGLKRIDDKTLEVSFYEFTPAILWGAGLTYQAEPAHYLKDIPIDKMESHDKVRKNPLSYGPFMVSNIVPGESVEYVPNPYWFGEKPKVDKIVAKRTSSDTIVEALKAGTFDIVNRINVNSYPEYKDLNNITLTSAVSRSLGYLGFKQGKWDVETKQVVPDPNAKLADVKLRQAIAYAMNNEEVAELFYNDLRIPANALITPYHASFWNDKQEGYPYNPEKAKQILDEAGYKDVDGDGLREDPKGNKLQINYLSMSGGDIAEPLAQFYIQNFRDVGLDVVLQNGRLIEMNAFYDMVEEDNEDIDLFAGAWLVGSNPEPSGLWGRHSLFNYVRFAADENDKLIQAINSNDAFGPDGMDNEYMVKAYHDWQKYAMEQVIVAPTHYRIELTALNNRVNYWDADPMNYDWGWEKVGLLADTPEKAK